MDLPVFRAWSAFDAYVVWWKKEEEARTEEDEAGEECLPFFVARISSPVNQLQLWSESDGGLNRLLDPKKEDLKLKGEWVCLPFYMKIGEEFDCGAIIMPISRLFSPKWEKRKKTFCERVLSIHVGQEKLWRSEEVIGLKVEDTYLSTANISVQNEPGN